MFLHVLINNKTKQMFKIAISPDVMDMFLQSIVRIRLNESVMVISSEKIRLKRMIHAKSGIAQ